MLLDKLYAKGKLQVITTSPINVCYTELTSRNKCRDISRNKDLDINDIDEDYELDVEERDDGRTNIMIPAGKKCTLFRASGRPNFIINYKNIEIELSIESDIYGDGTDIDYFFDEITE